MLTIFVQTLQVGVVFVYLDLPQRSSKKLFANVMFISQKLSCGTVVEAEYSNLQHLKRHFPIIHIRYGFWSKDWAGLDSTGML